MLFTKLTLLLGVAPFALGNPVNKNKYSFQPESASTYENDYVPALVNFSTSQLDTPTGSSWWANTYMTGSDGHQYMIVSHILSSGPTVESECRSSVLQIDTGNYWNSVHYCSPHNSSGEALPLDLQLENYGFVATSADSVSSMYTYGYGSNYSYNISLEATSTVLLNGGNAVIGFGADNGNATEWGLPACRTAGTLTLNDTVVTVDSSNSFTWYDRQISHSVPRNWTWFELHFPGSSIKASIWAFDYPDSAGTVSERFATVRVDEYSNYVMAYTLTPNMANAWTSPNSNLTYPLSWGLRFQNGDYLNIQSVRADQEMYGPHNTADSAYTGFIRVSGSFMGQKSAFGTVEMVTAYKL